MKAPGITAKLRTRQSKPGDQSINKSTFILSGYIDTNILISGNHKKMNSIDAF